MQSLTLLNLNSGVAPLDGMSNDGGLGPIPVGALCVGVKDSVAARAHGFYLRRPENRATAPRITYTLNKRLLILLDLITRAGHAWKRVVCGYNAI